MARAPKNEAQSDVGETASVEVEVAQAAAEALDAPVAAVDAGVQESPIVNEEREAPVVTEVEDLETKPTLKLRSNLAIRRAGAVFTRPGEEIEVEVEQTSSFAKRVVAWFNDPAISIVAKQGTEFEVVTELPDSVLKLAALEDEPSE